MKILLDTCTFLWIIAGSKELSSRAREVFVDPDADVYLSAASCWEISVKWSLGKLELPQEPRLFISRQRSKHGVLPLPISEEATYHLPNLPKIHKDPFDRILICQAIEGGMVLLTPDPLITAYPGRTIW